MKKKSIVIAILVFFLVGCTNQEEQPVTAKEPTDTVDETKDTTNEIQDLEEGEQTMKIILEGQEFPVVLQDNETVRDIVSMLPMEMTIERYAGHEYYASLQDTPTNDAEFGTSMIKENGVYYWDGWNAFVINYEDSDISPYTPIYIGDVEGDIASVLRQAEDNITIRIEQ